MTSKRKTRSAARRGGPHSGAEKYTYDEADGKRARRLAKKARKLGISIEEAMRREIARGAL